MEERFVDVEGIRTRYLEAGKGEPLLLIHGGDFGIWASADLWNLAIDNFADFFHVFAIDGIGRGFTDNPKSDEEYLIGTTVKHAYDFLKTMNIDHAHVVGQSRGGYTSCRLALEHPEMVRTLVHVASTTLMVPETTIHDEWDKQAELIEDMREKLRFRASVLSFRDDHITEEYLDLLVKIMTLPKTQEAAEKMRAGLKTRFLDDLAVKQKEVQDWIRKGGFKAPTLVVWGLNDPLAEFDPVGLATIQLILPSTPRSQVHIINEAGHFPFRDQPEAFVACVTSFITSNSGA